MLNWGYMVLSRVMLTFTSLNRVRRSFESKTLARPPSKLVDFLRVAMFE